MARGAEAEQRGDLKGALSIYTDALRNYAGPRSYISGPIDHAIDMALKMKPYAPIPAEATKHANGALIKIEAATTTGDLDVARLGYENALAIAPWWADAWFNLAALDEQMGSSKAAAGDLTFYLRAAPNAPGARQVKEKIDALEALPQREMGSLSRNAFTNAMN